MFPVVDSFDAVLRSGGRDSLHRGPGRRAVVLHLGVRSPGARGADAARFLQTLAEFLADPHRLTELTRAA